MSTQKPQPKDKANEPERRDDLTLDAETVKDLEPRSGAGERVRGGGRTYTCNGGTGSAIVGGAGI